jgi:hypothetical protein
MTNDSLSHDMTGPQAVDGGSALRIQTVVAHVMNQQAQTVDKGWSARLGVWER